MIYFDTETCGLHGPTVLIQWAEDEGEVFLHSVWTTPIDETLSLIEKLCDSTVVGFNLAFDWFHLCQTYTTLALLKKEVGGEAHPGDHIDLYAELEPLARDGPCLKPAGAMDLMLHARKGPYQSTMERKDVRIKKVPTLLAMHLRDYLEENIKLPEIYFARRKDKTADKWSIETVEEPDGSINPDFKNIVLRFKPSSALKVLAADALGYDSDDITMFKDVDVDRHYRPYEVGWAPFAKAVSSKGEYWTTKVNGKLKKAWPIVIGKHIEHWGYNKLAREYAEKDVTITRELYHFFADPGPNDDDSILSCMVGAVRWRGYSVDIDKIRKLRDTAKSAATSAPTAPAQVYNYISEFLSETEKAVIGTSTKKTVLVELAERSDEAIGQRAAECLKARMAQYEINFYNKIIQAGRLHASFKVIGTLSSRMSGADGLNPQGIKGTEEVRSAFSLAWPGEELSGGDFAGFEVAIAESVYNDPELRKQLSTCSNCNYVCTLEEFHNSDDCIKCGAKDSRKKIHGLFAQELFDKTYDEIVATKGTENDLYGKGKGGVFSQMYGGNFATLMNRLGIEEEVAINAEQGFARRFRGIGQYRESISEMFCSMRQPAGLGTQVVWHEPAEKITTVNGFSRYFTMENDICRALFNLANKLPKEWKAIKIKCVRRERQQTIGGAVMSALFAAAFNIQSQVLRAAANHVIQSSGALITKKLQCRIWELQPSGIDEWIVQPMNIHDEVMVVKKPGTDTKTVVEKLVLETRDIVPLIKIDWGERLKSWASK